MLVPLLSLVRSSNLLVYALYLETPHAAPCERPVPPSCDLRGLKRREKNRNAARKSRKKQTERADELHEELQSLERSNSALQREIATLTKELHVYEAALKRHEPHCRLKTSPPSSTALFQSLTSSCCPRDKSHVT
uniref:BZIP domain-containing protein n=1 Tax=Salarias fasciatus TaxID=181472 RepID=A0A672JPE5_SALFA